MLRKIKNDFNNIQNVPVENGGKLIPLRKSGPREHQEKAIEDVLKGLDTSDKGKLIMPCRTGKTPTSIFISEAMFQKGYQGVRLFVAPTLLLLKQTKDDYLKLSNLKLKFGIICSDGTVGKTEDLDTTEEELGEVSLGVAKDNDSIKELLRNEELTHIFCTYKSLPKLAKVLKSKEFKNFSFDLGFADEAHKTATKKESYLSTFHKEKDIRIKKRIYMTASPRVYGGSSKKEARLTHCMDDENVYGSELHTLSFKRAIEKKIIRDFKILVTTLPVDADKMTKVLSKASNLKLGKYLLDGSIVNAVEATEKTIKEYEIRKAFAFFSNIDRSKAFVFAYRILYPNRFVDEVSSRDKPSERDKKLNEFKNGNTQVLANARLLSEGITVGDADLVLFGDSKSSKIDIIQSSSRVLNYSPTRKYGYILLPANISNDCDAKQAIKNGDFDTIVTVLRAMQSIDESLNDEILRIANNGPRNNTPFPGGGTSPDEEDKIIFEYDKDEISNSLKIETYKEVLNRSAVQKHTYESIRMEALKYKTRGEFFKESQSAYNAAKRLGILDSVCSHMKGNKSWDEESIKKEALKYKTRGEFQKKSRGAYRAAQRRGILDSVCSHMKRVLKSWDEESLKKEALKYKTRKEFDRKSGSAYSAARRLGILDSVCSHMQGNKSWDDEIIKKEALKYKTRKEFERKSSAYSAAKRLGILDSVCKHMKCGRIKWDEESLKKEALKYKTRYEFQKKNGGAYDTAQKRGILDSVCSHMQKAYKSWDEESIRKEALKYKTRGEFQKKSSSAYRAARGRGILDSVCKHMKSGRVKWHEKSIKKEALKYKTRGEFYKKSTSAYNAARKLGILDSVCEHMKKIGK